MSNIVPLRQYSIYSGPKSVGQRVSHTFPPEQLPKILEVAPYIRMSFPSQAKLLSYRAMLYKVNREGQFRYSTRREGWSALIILRLK